MNEAVSNNLWNILKTCL